MSRTRCFLAVELSEGIKERVMSLQHDLRRTLSSMKWVGEDNMHVTLLFLGEVDDREIVQVCRLAQQAVQEMPPFPLAIEGFGCFPHARRPRVLWVGVGQGKEEMLRLYDALATPLSALGYRREDRPYSPHITLGRTKSDGPMQALGDALEKYRTWEGGTMQVDEVLLMGSELTREGPIYTVLGRAILGTKNSQE